MTEYIKRTNAEHPLPETIGYVSEVNNSTYRITRFSTKNLSIQSISDHDDQYETFDFLQQSLNVVPFDKTEPRIKAHEQDPSKYYIRGDDGWFMMQCPFDEHFNISQNTCMPVSPCHNKLPGMYGMTEALIDRLVLNHRVPFNDDTTNNESVIHPTTYLRCLEGGSHVVAECPENFVFDANTGSCQMLDFCRDKPNYFILPYVPETLNADEWEECYNHKVRKRQCEPGFIFDRNLQRCVETHPCSREGTGHTYLTADTGPNQFYECTSFSSSRLMTCIARVYNNGRYSCTGNEECIAFDNGTGTQIFRYEDDVLSFDRGIIQCDNYNVVNNVTCDTSNLLQDSIFNNRFVVNVHLPKETYDASQNTCVSLTFDRLTIKSKNFSIENLPNDYDIDFETSFVGRTSQAMELLNNNKLDNVVWYARDQNVVGVNYLTGESIDCFGSFLYDIFDGRKLNICTDQSTPEFRNISDGEYFKSKHVEIANDALYTSVCAQQLDTTTNFVEFDVFFRTKHDNILPSSECVEFFKKITFQYTTPDSKYTTIYPQYTRKAEKSTKNIERYASNTHIDKNEIQPLFDPFEREEIIQPLFDPFIFDPPPFEPQPPAEEPLWLQNTEYSCFYSVPTFKMSSCRALDTTSQTLIQAAKRNITVEPECAKLSGLSNVLNSYAYMDGVGCKCEWKNDGVGLIVRKVSNPVVYRDVETQSNDGFKYNHWLHYKDGNIMACPDSLYNHDTFTCNNTLEILYYVQNMQD